MTLALFGGTGWAKAAAAVLAGCSGTLRLLTEERALDFVRDNDIRPFIQEKQRRLRNPGSQSFAGEAFRQTCPDLKNVWPMVTLSNLPMASNAKNFLFIIFE